MAGDPEPRFKGDRRPRFSFTASEWKALFVIGLLFIIGVVLLQLKRYKQRDTTQVLITDSIPLDTSLVKNIDLQEGSAGKEEAVDSEREAGQIYYLETDSQDQRNGLTGEIAEKININTADQEELETLPGIGPVLAQRIIEFRDEFGLFREVEDLLLVKGIGEKRSSKEPDYWV